MRQALRIVVVTGVLLVLALLTGCAAESPETQQLYTDAREMWDQMNRSFTLPRGEERREIMLKMIDEQWDRKIPDMLERYIRESPNGKYAKEAKALLEEARASQELRMLGQARPLLQETGMPKSQEEIDSMAKAMQQRMETEPGNGDTSDK